MKITPPYSVRSGALAGYPELVRYHGARPEALLAQAGIAPDILNDPDRFIPYLQLAELLELTADRLNAPFFGLQLGASQGLQILGLIGIYMVQQPTLTAALEVAEKYHRLHAQGVNLQRAADPAPGYQRLSFQLLFDRPQADVCRQRDSAYPQLLQLSLMLLARLIYQMRPEAKGLELTLRQRPASPVQATATTRNILQRAGLGDKARLKFSAESDALRLPERLLHQPPRQPDNLNSEIIARQFPHCASPDEVSTRELTRHAIRMLLPTGDCDKDRVAGSIGLHPKQLERQLKQEGTHFRQLLQQTRKEIALQLIGDGQRPLMQLALTLGYSEFSAFSRSFKSWFGVSPRGYLKAFDSKCHQQKNSTGEDGKAPLCALN